MLGCELAACTTHSNTARAGRSRAHHCPRPRAHSEKFSPDSHLFGRQKRDKWNSFCSQPLDFMAVPTGLEPVTFGLGNRCSVRLSYGTNSMVSGGYANCRLRLFSFYSLHGG